MWHCFISVPLLCCSPFSSPLPLISLSLLLHLTVYLPFHLLFRSFCCFLCSVILSDLSLSAFSALFYSVSLCQTSMAFPLFLFSFPSFRDKPFPRSHLLTSSCPWTCHWPIRLCGCYFWCSTLCRWVSVCACGWVCTAVNYLNNGEVGLTLCSLHFKHL